MRPFLAPESTAAPRSDRPSFSVVIAAYQAAATVAEAVESVLGQTEAPCEVIVVDDGSTDGTAAALGPYAGRIQVICQENQGPSGARNAGVAAARGEFVVFLDADDVFLGERLAALGELAVLRPDLDVVGTDAWLEEGGRVVRACYDATWLFETEGQRSAILRRNFVLAHAAVRRDRFLAVGGFDETMRYAEDWDLWIRLVLAGSGIGLVAEPLARYRLTPGSLSSRRASLLAGRIRALERALARDDLSPSERDVASASLARERRSHALAAAQEALRSGAPDARRLALAVARGPGQGPSTRLKALLGALAPRTAARLLRDRPVETTAGLAAVAEGER